MGVSFIMHATRQILISKAKGKSEEPTRRVLTAGVLAAVTLFLAACTAHQKPSTVETVLATMAKDIVIPMQAENLKNPLTGDPQVISQGKQTYLQSCAICHG